MSFIDSLPCRWPLTVGSRLGHQKANDRLVDDPGEASDQIAVAQVLPDDELAAARGVLDNQALESNRLDGLQLLDAYIRMRAGVGKPSNEIVCLNPAACASARTGCRPPLRPAGRAFPGSHRAAAGR